MISVDASELRDLGNDLIRGAATVPARAAAVVRTSIHDTEDLAKSLVEVDTGELRDSIHTVITGLTGEVIADADHAPFVEEGTSVMAPQPFMGPALARNERPFVTGMTNVAEDLL